MGFSSFVVIEKNILLLIYSKLHSQSYYYLCALSFIKLSKVTDVFTQFLIFFSRKLIRKDKTSKGEGGKADFKATIITY